MKIISKLVITLTLVAFIIPLFGAQSAYAADTYSSYKQLAKNIP